MNSMNELINIAKEHGGIIETKTAAEHGVSKNMLYKLCKENKMPIYVFDMDTVGNLKKVMDGEKIGTLVKI